MGFILSSDFSIFEYDKCFNFYHSTSANMSLSSAAFITVIVPFLIAISIVYNPIVRYTEARCPGVNANF